MSTTTVTQVSTDEQVSQFVTALAAVSEFPSGKFSNRLFNKIRLTNFLQNIRDDISAEESFGSDSQSAKLHDKDVSTLLEAMAAQYFAQAVAKLDSSHDHYSFRDTVDKSSANRFFEDSIIRVAPFLFAEHISSELLAKSPTLPKVQDLQKDSKFVEAYHKKLTDKTFIQGTIFAEVVKKDHRHSTNLLFMLAYLESRLELKDAVAQGDVWTRKIGSVGSTWVTELIDSLKADVEQVTNHISQSLGPIFAYTRTEATKSGTMSIYDKSKLQQNLFVTNPSLPQAGTASTAASNALKQIQDKLSKLGQGAGTNWKAVQDHLWTQMDASSSKLQDAVTAQTVKQTQSSRSEAGFGWQGSTTTYVTGQKVAEIIDKGAKAYPDYFKRSAPKHDYDESQSTSSLDNMGTLGWCLVAGTMIMTDNGPKAIEDLRDGDTVVSSASPKGVERATEFGSVSDEARKVEVKKPKIFGINGMPGFFTGSHVFHTTTGLRAIDPATANRLNPAASIGQMRVGHVLLRLDDSMQYDLVTIESIEASVAEEVDVVYDLHLSKGRSYHANGFLTSVNYPEVSPKQVAQALTNLAPHDRLKLLYRFPELQEVLSQFDSTTLSNSLTQEIQNEAKRRTARFYKAGAPGAGRVPLLDIDRTFQIFHAQGQSTESLPNTLTIDEGLVILDGDNLLTQAHVDHRNSSIRWTRQVEQGRYEHGRVELESTGMTGRGAVIYTPSINPDNAERDEAGENTVTFRLFATNDMKAPLREDQEQQVLAIEESSFDDVEEKVQASEPQTLAAPQQTFSSAAAQTIQPPVATASTEMVLEGSSFSLTLDLDKEPMEYTADAGSIKKLAKPVPFGNIQLDISLPKGPKGIKLVTVSVPHLNRLRDAINAAAPAHRKDFINSITAVDPQTKPEDFSPVGEINKLYTSSVTQNEKGQLVANVRMIDAASLASIANSSNDIRKKFSDALPGTDIAVPIIFQELEVVIRSDFSSAFGSIYEWDGESKGMLGTRHFMRSTTLKEEEDARNTKRSDNAEKAGEIVSSNPKDPISTPQAPPSDATNGIDLSGQLDCDTLLNLEQYNEYSIHKITGSLLQETLRYHMDDTDRANFTLTQKNDQSLPLELRDKLPEKLKTWIKTKYNKVYISFLIAQGAKNPFSKQQQDKLWYWWQGSSPGTLKKTPEYAEMNKIAGTYAMRQLYQKHLDPFIKAGGKHWADQLRAQYDSDSSKNGLLMSFTAMKNSGVNQVNKICNLMNALDPDGTQAATFYNAFLNYGVKMKVLSSNFIGDSGELKTFLYDAMYQLVLMVLNKDEALDADIRAGIAADIEPIRKQKEASVKTQMDLLGDELNYMATLVGKYVGQIAKGVNFKGVTSMFDQIEGTVKVGDPTAFPKTFKALRAAAIIGMIGGSIYLGVSTFLRWKDLSDGQRGLAICSILQTVSYTLQTLRYFKKNPIIELGRVGGPRPPGARRPPLVLQMVEGDVIRQNLERQNIIPDGLSDGSNSTAASSRSGSLLSEGSNPDFDGLGPLPPPGQQRPKFNIAMGLLKALDIFIGIGFVVFLSMEIKANYENMSTTERILSICQVVIQGLVVLVDVATIGVEIAASVGWIGVQAASRALCCLATLGAIFGVLALAIMIGLIIYELTRPKPKTEAEKFADANKGLVDSLPDPPSIGLTYEVDKTSVPRNSDQDITVTITNKGSANVELQQLAWYFNAGGETSLFEGAEAVKKDLSNSDSADSKAVAVRFQPSDASIVSDLFVDEKPQASTTVCLSGSIRGKQKQAGQSYEKIVMKPKDWLKVLIKGRIVNKDGETSLNFVEYKYPKDAAVAEPSKMEVKITKT